MSSTDNNSTHQ